MECPCWVVQTRKFFLFISLSGCPPSRLASLIHVSKDIGGQIFEINTILAANVAGGYTYGRYL